VRSLQSELTRPPSGGLFLCLDKYFKKIMGKAAVTQSRLEESIQSLIVSNKLDGENGEGNKMMSSTGYSLGVNVEYTYDVDQKKIDKMVRAIDKTYGLMESDDDKKHYVVGRGSGAKKRLRFHQQKKGSGRVKTEMQEKGTTIIFENVLNGDANFKKETDIMKHTKTAKELRATFKGVEHLLDNWIWTFFQQQDQFIQEYSDKKWSTFEYGGESFVDFFSNEILPFVSRSGGGKSDAGKYTGWNPADIWAVRNKSAVQKKIKAAMGDGKKPKPQSLLEINTILVKLMEKNPPDLVGISLKMIKYKQNAHVRLFNVETSPILKQLKSFIPLEEYTMKDIHFEPDNIINLKAVTTYVNYKNKDFSINITRSNNNMSFNTQIKGAAAQGGQTPIAMVFDMLKNPPNWKRFATDYPQDRKKFNIKAPTYKPMWELVSGHCKTKTTMTWEKWVTEMNVLYVEDERDAKVTLMQLAFWNDAITKFGKNSKKSAEFWTDMLYFGMKITTKGQFAPHAKIS